MITIIDYGLGNVGAFVNTYKRLSIDCSVGRTADQINDATGIILPGVGAFDHAIHLFESSGLAAKVRDKVESGVPMLGVCVGMQMLAGSSEEGKTAGLAYLDARVRSLNSLQKTRCLPIPHMGWNAVTPSLACPLFTGINDDCRFYFLHSYFIDCASNDESIATCDYGDEFTCAVQKSNVYGVQFHPEKSHHWGVRLLSNFAGLCEC